MTMPMTNIAGTVIEQAEEQVKVQVDRQHVAEIGAEHDQDALRDVDDVEHAEDQREPGRHQRVDAAAEYPGRDGLRNLGRHLSSVPLSALRDQPVQLGFG